MTTPREPSHTEPGNSREAYWDHYYAAQVNGRRRLPSQFAAFVCGELRGRHRVVEFGCGSGRDSLFFSSYGHQVLGVDASESAVKRCWESAHAVGSDANFLQARIDDPDLPDRIKRSEDRSLLYARFFLHAITEEEELAFLRCAAAISRSGDLLAVEYRTVRDVRQAKVTGQHYRRFIDPAAFQLRAAQHAFSVQYAVEGFGFAKYEQDDAYVARCLLVRDAG